MIKLTPKFGLRFILLLTLLCAIAVSVRQRSLVDLWAQQAAVEQIAASSKEVQFKWRPIQPAVYRDFLTLFVDREHLRYVYGIEGERCFSDELMALLPQMPFVEELYIASNSISDEGLENVRHLPRLRKVSLWKTDVTDEGLSALAECKKLEKLDIGIASTDHRFTRRFTYRCLKPFESHPSLRELIFSFPINREGLEVLQSIPNLRMNPEAIGLVAPDDFVIESVSDFDRLKEITIYGGSFTSVAALGKPEDLERMFLSGAINDLQLNGLGELSNLTTLDLSGTKVSNGIGQEVSRLKRLQTLYCQGTKVDCDFFGYLEHLTDLKYVRSGCSADDDACEVMAKLGIPLAGTFYLSDVGLGHLAKVKRLVGCSISDAVYGRREAGIDVDGGRWISDTGLAAFLSSSESVGEFDIEADKATLAFLNGAKGKNKDRMLVSLDCDLARAGNLHGLIPVPLPSVDGIEIGVRSLTLTSNEAVRRVTVPFPIESFPFDLAVLKRLPGLKKIVCENGSPGNFANDWSWVHHCQHLEILQLGHFEPRLNATEIEGLGSLAELQELKVCLAQIGPGEFKPLAGLRSLRDLEMCGPPLTPDQFEVLGKLESLERLLLLRYPHNTKQPTLDPIRSGSFEGLKSLKELSIYGMTDESMPEICGLPNLERLSIEGELSDRSLAELKRLPKLRQIDARASGLSDKALAELEEICNQRRLSRIQALLDGVK